MGGLDICIQEAQDENLRFKFNMRRACIVDSVMCSVNNDICVIIHCMKRQMKQSHWCSGQITLYVSCSRCWSMWPRISSPLTWSHAIFYFYEAFKPSLALLIMLTRLFFLLSNSNLKNIYHKTRRYMEFSYLFSLWISISFWVKLSRLWEKYRISSICSAL
jgi:hypothetical protein